MSRVLKFGGTSVGSAINMRMVGSIIQREDSKVTVLSAMSGTTDSLVKICQASQNGEDISQIIQILTDKYIGCVEELLTSNLDAAKDKIKECFDNITALSKDYKPSHEGIILSQGELLTTALFTMYLSEQGLKAELIDILSYMRVDEQGQVDTAYLRSSLEALLSSHDSDTYFITQGFICRGADGNVTNLGRGGSDYSAALIGAAIACEQVQIWTDIDGMHNNDPRFVEGTYPIRKMNFTEAAELAYFGAKILHPSTIQPCKESGISVRLKSTMDPDAEGTLITSDEDDSQKFHAVAAKDGITVIRICSARMLMAYGFLRKVFEVFETYKTPIDMITTSEVAVSLTIDNNTHLDEIVAELSKFGTIDVERNCTIICVVGSFHRGQTGLAAKITSSLESIPLRMISYGASNYSVAMLVNAEHKVTALRLLNKTLFENVN